MKVGIVGIGAWGPNLVRNFYQIDGIEVAVCDLNSERLAQIQRQYRGVKATGRYEEWLKDPSCKAIVVATPAATHYELTRKALLAGKHVLVEKPIGVNSQEIRELIRIAETSRLVLMVGHTFEYNPAVVKLKELIQTGQMGLIYYLYSRRLNLGQIREDLNAMWSLAPHDISILMFLLGQVPKRVSARGKAFLQEGIEDVVFLTLEFPTGALAQVHVSWLDPRKERTLTVVGSKKMAIYDDMDNEAKLRIYDKGASRFPLGEFGEYFIKLRSGDVSIPKIELWEPLALECRHFLDCIQQGLSPRTDGQNGLRVVEVLEAAQVSLKQDGIPVKVSESTG